jgi:hypothetical protein
MTDTPLVPAGVAGDSEPQRLPTAGWGDARVVALALSPFIVVVCVLAGLAAEDAATSSLCRASLGGSCQSAAAPDATNTFRVYGRGVGCPSSSQACVLDASDNAASVYGNDALYSRCWATTAANASAAPRVWIHASLSAALAADTNLTRALACCRFLPGGAAGASVGTVVITAAMSAVVNVALNLLMRVPSVARAVALVKRVLTLEPCGVPRAIDWCAARVAAAMRYVAACAVACVAALRRCWAADTADGDEATVSFGWNRRRGTGEPGAADRDAHASLFRAEADAELDSLRASRSGELLDGDALADDIARDRAASASLGSESWVDDSFVPSRLTVLKTCVVSLLGVVAASHGVSVDEHLPTLFQKYNAWCARIMNSAVFASWLDISVAFFVCYTSKGPVLRRGRTALSVQMMAPLLSMAEYVVLIFTSITSATTPWFARSKQKQRQQQQQQQLQQGDKVEVEVEEEEEEDDERARPSVRFFARCPNARIAMRVSWVAFLSAYLTHIVPASVIFLPFILIYFFCFVMPAGLLCVLVARLMDIHGDEWAQPATRPGDAAADALAPLANEGTGLIAPADVEAAAAAPAAASGGATLFARQMRTFLGRFALAVIYSICASGMYTLLSNWAVLAYASPQEYLHGAGYATVVGDELSIRSLSCSWMRARMDAMEALNYLLLHT